jgi:hypothetical protein
MVWGGVIKCKQKTEGDVFNEVDAGVREDRIEK